MPVKPADKTELYICLCFGNLLYKRGGRNVSQNHSITTSKKKLKRGNTLHGSNWNFYKKQSFKVSAILYRSSCCDKIRLHSGMTLVRQITRRVSLNLRTARTVVVCATALIVFFVARFWREGMCRKPLCVFL